MNDLNIDEVEREIRRLPEISAVRLVQDDDGAITEVHLVAPPGRKRKRIVRTVRSVALATFGLELDEETISVVRGDTLREGSAEAPRPSIIAITAESNGLRSLVRVTLGRDDAITVGFAEGSIALSARHRLVATATIDALRQLEPSAECVDLAHAEVVRVGAQDVAVVTVVLVVPPAEQMMSGSAIVRPQQEADAVARAVLDATNRRLPHVSLR